MSASQPRPSSLKGKVAVVTGGLSGIGAAVVRRFADEGASVVAADLSATAKTLGRDPTAPFHVDVADPASVAALVAAVVDGRGRIDCLVNSAGVGYEAPFFDTTVETFDRLMTVNLRGTFVVGQAVARAMARTGGGAIVNLSSVSGVIGNLNRTAYSASKAGVVGLSRAMAVDLAPLRIRVNVLAPGPVETPLVAAMHAQDVRDQWIRRLPMHRYAQPDEIAGAAAFLCSDDAGFVTGHVMAVDGGFLGAGLVAEGSPTP